MPRRVPCCIVISDSVQWDSPRVVVTACHLGSQRAALRAARLVVRRLRWMHLSPWLEVVVIRTADLFVVQRWDFV